MHHRNRVVITGIGLLTPVGINTKETWHSITNGRSGISYCDVVGQQVHSAPVAGRVHNDQERFNAVLSPQEQRKTDRFVQLALCAADEALRDAEISCTIPEQRERCGVYVGVGIGGVHMISEASCALQERGPKAISPLLLPKVICNEAAAWISMKWNFQGAMCSVVNACSSSGDAVGLAFRSIRDGYADYMIAGGTESCLTPLAFAGFGNMRTLSAWQGDPHGASRPFDAQRSGFVMSEGAGILVLERYDLARKRGANIYAELVGYGASSDAYHVTAMHPDGRGALLAIQNALDDAQIDSSLIGYINAHGTSTQMNDAIETAAIKKVFGARADKKNDDRVLVSSTKSMTGHLLGAAGGLEISLTALALKNGVLPPTINLDYPDPVCDLDYISPGAREKKVTYALSNSFGFGGGNSVVVLKRV